MAIIFCIILGILALPLFLFLAVNFELIPEIRTEFISIPKLTGFRGGELSLANIKQSILAFIRILFLNQGNYSSVFNVSVTGIYYYFTTPFTLLGIGYHLYNIIKNYKNGKKDLSITLFLWLISAAIISVINETPNIIHMNMVHIPIIFYAAYGIYGLKDILKIKVIPSICIGFYAVSFMIFCNFYVNDDFGYFFDEKPYEALVRAKEIAGEQECIIFFGQETYKFPNWLWREKPNIRHYSENVVYDDNPFFADLVSYENYRCITLSSNIDAITSEGVYIIASDQIGVFVRKGFEIEQINDSYAVAAMSIPTK